MLTLPIELQELAAALSIALDPTRPEVALAVRDVTLRQPAGVAETATLVLQVRVTRPSTGVTSDQASPEHWRVSIPVSAAFLDPGVTRQAFVMTLRANLEEWWDTKAADPVTGSWGERVAGQLP